MPNAYWTLSLEPRNGWMDIQPLVVQILIALFITALITGFIFYHLRQPQKLHRLVDERTRQLAETNRNLAEEVSVRERAEWALQVAKELLEDRVRMRTAELEQAKSAAESANQAKGPRSSHRY